MKQRPPLGESRTKALVVDQACTEPVQSVRHPLDTARTERDRAPIYLDSRDDAAISEELRYRCPVVHLLPDGLVIENHGADVPRQVGCTEQADPIALTRGGGGL